jgi:hypothetical protein
MNNRIKAIVVSFSLSLSFCTMGWAQTEFSSFNLTGHGQATVFATDYQCLGINPANTSVKYGEFDRRIAFGLGETAFSLHSGILAKRELMQNIFRSDFEQLDLSKQLDYAYQFSQENNAFDLDITNIGFSVNAGKVGSFAFAIKDRVDFCSKFGPKVSELIWLGRNANDIFSELMVTFDDNTVQTLSNNPDSLSAFLSTIDTSTISTIQGLTDATSSNMNDLLQGTKIHFSWMREFNFAYSLPIIESDELSIYGGLGIKFLRGQALMTLDSKDGQTEAFAGFSPMFSIQYDENNVPSGFGKFKPSLVSPKPIGFGTGLDIGFTLKYSDYFFASAAITDIGGINWKTDIFEFSNDTLLTLDYNGMQNVDLASNISQISLGSDLIDWRAKMNNYKTQLPTTFRLGMGVYLLDRIKLGFDLVAPMNDAVANIEKAVITAGGEVRLPLNFKVSMGIAKGGNYNTTRITAGISKMSFKGIYEWGIASRDLVTFITNNEPTVSLAFGFLRFRI